MGAGRGCGGPTSEVSWDVKSALALKHGASASFHVFASTACKVLLTTLARIRDLKTCTPSCSKAGYYPQHLFIHVIVHTLIWASEEAEDRATDGIATFADVLRSYLPRPMNEEDEADDV